MCCVDLSKQPQLPVELLHSYSYFVATVDACNKIVIFLPQIGLSTHAIMHMLLATLALRGEML